jgi:hypothetical protein
MTLTSWLPPNISAPRERTSLAKPHESHSLSGSQVA